MKTVTRTVAPGIVVREGVHGRTVRFYAMIRGERFCEAFKIPCAPGVSRALAESYYFDRSGKATRELKAAHAAWVMTCGRTVGETYGGSGREPTLGELFEEYEKIAEARRRNPNFRKPGERTIYSALANARICMAAAGLKDTSKVGELFNTKTVERLFYTFCETKRGVTAWTYIQGLKSVTAHWTLAKYEERGWAIPRFNMPDVGKARQAPRYHRPPQETIDKMNEFYVKIATSAQHRDWHVVMMMIAQFAVRPMNVFDLTGKNIVKDEGDGLWHLRYTPTKTENSSGAEVNYPIHPIYWQELEPLIGAKVGTEEALVKGSKWTLAQLNCTGRVFCGMEDSEKFLYEYRKLCIDETRMQKGYDVAVALTGDRRDTLEYYYSEPGRVVDASPAMVVPAVGAVGA